MIVQVLVLQAGEVAGHIGQDLGYDDREILNFVLIFSI